MHQFHAEDSGDTTKIGRSASGMLAMKTLSLKRGCPVMLLINFSNTLVNGSLGRVVDFTDDGPFVEFPDANVTLQIKKHSFTGRCILSFILLTRHNLIF